MQPTATDIENFKRYKEIYADDQEGLYKSAAVRMLFDLGHKYIATRGKGKNGTIIDVGSGMGYHIKFEELNDNRTYIALDIDAKTLDKIPNAQIKKVVSDLEHVPLEDNTADIIIASHILEHVPNLDTTLTEIKRLLKDDGKFLVVLPCDPGLLWNTLTQFSPSRKRLAKAGFNYEQIMSMDHVNQFKKCKALLEKHFKQIDNKYYPALLPLHDLNILFCAEYHKR